MITSTSLKALRHSKSGISNLRKGSIDSGQKSATLKRSISEDLSSEAESRKKKVACLARGTRFKARQWENEDAEALSGLGFEASLAINQSWSSQIVPFESDNKYSSESIHNSYASKPNILQDAVYTQPTRSSRRLFPENRPEKCPIETCEYHKKGFARKYDKTRHTLTHYKGTIVCPFCPGPGTAFEKIFNRIDVSKRHLIDKHNVEKTPPNSRKVTMTGSGSSRASGARCSICQAQFSTAQEFHDHIDECVMREIMSKASVGGSLWR